MRHHHFDHPSSKARAKRGFQVFPGRPFSHNRYGIELQDYSDKSGLLCRASLEPDKPLSWHPALRA